MSNLARIISLASGHTSPQNGMEIHFAKVLANEATACSDEERAWIYSLEVAQKLTPSALLQILSQAKADAETIARLESEIRIAGERQRACASKADRLSNALENAQNLLVDYEFRHGPLLPSEHYHRDENWKALDQPHLAEWRNLRKAKHLMIPPEIEAKELHKPDWLRGLSAGGADVGILAKARWVAADKDGNPLSE